MTQAEITGTSAEVSPSPKSAPESEINILRLVQSVQTSFFHKSSPVKDSLYNVVFKFLDIQGRSKVCRKCKAISWCWYYGMSLQSEAFAKAGSSNKSKYG